MKSLTVARSAGFCAGVSRSVAMAEEALRKDSQVWCVGELIHNGDELRRLASLGMHFAACPEEVPEGACAVLRAHGEVRRTYEVLQSKGCTVVDTVCPKVMRSIELARKCREEGRLLFVYGDSAHPEVRAILDACPGALAFSGPEELEALSRQLSEETQAAALLAQTTKEEKVYEKIKSLFKKIYTNSKIFDTICNATHIRQTEAEALASQCDAMVVVGSAGSSNSRNLAALCAEHCTQVQFVENASGLDPEKLRKADRVGLTAGASVPAWIIKEVIVNMDENMTAQVEGEESFEQLLENSINKTINNGDTVTGTVVGITPTEIQVDVGTKYAGFIPTEEYTDGTNEKIENLVHVGDEVNAIAVRVSDVDGTVKLSKKRLDAQKNWVDIAAAAESGEVVEGKVTEVNKGGVVVSVNGIRVFVPASQSGMPRNADLGEMVGKDVRLVVKEVNRSRKRVVGSIGEITRKERREKADAVWTNIEVGKRYTGTVKSLASYGAFVDIGGVDGMVHVSELSWKRISKPADMLSVGDTVEVYVIGFDKDTHKISLGYKDPNGNPWDLFKAQYQVGSVANVTIVKLMTYGAFAEVVDGVDGLIHISQIANRRIGKPEDVLTVGEKVDAKIIAIDDEKHKVSLSIRALSEPEAAPAAKEEEAPKAEGDALVYEVSETGAATGNAPEADAE